MEIRFLSTDERKNALTLSWETFLKFEGPVFSQEGIETFKKFIGNKEQIKDFEFIGAFSGEQIIGVLAFSPVRKHISLFFVDEEYHKQGIGRKLWDFLLANKNYDKITVNSSPYAIEVYHKLGFEDTDVEQIGDGIIFTPMCYYKKKPRKYKLYQIDSFTNEKFLGNPAGVIYNAKGLSDEEMQKIAREMNNSETAFVFLDKNDEYDVHVRFFTPSNEVPICGHATIAAHYVIALENEFTEKKIIRQKTGAGILDVEIEPVEKSYTITMTQGEISFGNVIENENLNILVNALGIKRNDLITEAPVQIVSTGHSKVMIGIKEYSQLHYLKPDMKKLKELSEIIKCNGYFVFTLITGEEGVLTKGRMFAPAIGIEEDPVTGNANGPLGAYIVKYNLVEIPENKFSFIGKQGMSIKRDGQMKVRVDIKNGKPEKVKISGKAVTVFKTELIIE